MIILMHHDLMARQLRDVLRLVEEVVGAASPSPLPSTAGIALAPVPNHSQHVDLLADLG